MIKHTCVVIVDHSVEYALQYGQLLAHLAPLIAVTRTTFTHHMCTTIYCRRAASAIRSSWHSQLPV
jgi:hypothetical protein